MLVLARLRPLQELILFSRADLERSIPSLVDGIKCGQRKVLHICLSQNIVNDIKVRPFATISLSLHALTNPFQDVAAVVWHDPA